MSVIWEEQLTDWIRATDSHAGHRLLLIERAQRILDGQEAAAGEDRAGVAGALERWRYQHLNHCRGRYQDSDRQLLDTLDLLACQVAQRTARPPRNPREAICAQSTEPVAIRTAMAALDCQLPLQEITERAQAITDEHFGPVESSDSKSTVRRRMLMYAPLYLSSYCANECTYCGFSYPLPLERRHLSLAEVLREADLLAARGFRHILLVAGDYASLTSVKYYTQIVRALAARGVLPSIEIAPQTTAAYGELVEAGAVAVTLYQETYDERRYAEYHRRGSKTSFDWRLEGPERGLEAGFARIGLGPLLGLAEPQADLLAVMRHAIYLRKRFPDRVLAFSLPRIQDAPTEFRVPFQVDNETFIRMYCALRLAFPDAELVLSTREPPEMRARLARICITQLSAGSSTVPGGYGDPSVSDARDGQFPVADHRSPAEVVGWLEQAGFHPVWSLPDRV
jgi:2-iminoacetate synthase